MKIASILALATVIILSQPSYPEEVEQQKMIRPIRLDAQVEERILEDPDTGKKNLQLVVNVKSKEWLFNNSDMILRLLVVGKYKGSDTPYLRLILNQSQPFDLKKEGKFQFESEIMYSGQGNPDHVNYGIVYRGYALVIEDKFGNPALTKSTNRSFLKNYEKLRSIKSGEDFLR